MPASGVPQLPFPEFKWRWASLAPTEGLNRPDIFLGVLRALADNEGKPNNDPAVFAALQQVEAELNIPNGPRLARSADRNIIRNSGQYWKALGVLESQTQIALTPLGQRYAHRELTSTEFAIHTVVNHTLPSSVYPDGERDAWKAAGLTIRPLLLILQTVAELAEYGESQSFMTEEELASIAQPLSAVRAEPRRIAAAIRAYRSQELDISAWPVTTTQANDRRVSNEFLRFLRENGLLIERVVGGERRFGLGMLTTEDIAELGVVSTAALVGSAGLEDEIGSIALIAERRRVTRAILERPGQQRFRRQVMAAASTACFLTGTKVVNVLEAAHVRPVAVNGSDDVSNGLCVRSDIHALFDANRIRVRPDGRMFYTAELRDDPYYGTLARSVTIPNYVDRRAIEWRWSFY